MGKCLLLSCGLFAPLLASAQLTVSTALNPTELVEQVLIGNGVSVSNVLVSGNAFQRGHFNGTNSNIGLAAGVVLSTGNVNDIPPPVIVGGTISGPMGGGGDADLLSVAQSVTSNPQAGSITETNDVATIEFDFVPVGDTVSFNFVFASDEYTTYINTSFNDVFGFFLSGPGIIGPYAAPAAFPDGAVNLAFVPGTTDPITISTIYPPLGGGNPGLNSQYYIDNQAMSHNFNGFTTVLPIGFDVQCGQTYHFKFAIADAQDDGFDSAVFLEAGSFSSPAVEVDIKPSGNYQGGYTIIEGCFPSEIIFSRPSDDLQNPLTVNYSISGTATEGIDYSTLTNPIVFPAGEDTVVISISPFIDATAEGIETVIITVVTITPCGTQVVNTGTLYISDLPPLTVDLQDVTTLCPEANLPLVATPADGLAPYTYSWSYGSQTDSIAYVPNLVNGQSTTYTVTVTDACGSTTTESAIVTLNQTLFIDDAYMQPGSACNNDGVVVAVVSGVTGIPHYHWTGPGNPGSININGTVMTDLPPGWYYFTVSDDVCSLIDSVEVTQNNPQAIPTPVPDEGYAPLNVTFINESENATVFDWDFGNGQSANDVGIGNQSAQYGTPGVYEVMLIAYEGTCTDTAYVSITVYPPAPVSAEAPNVFTPNGDGENDLFVLKTVNAHHFDVVIINRWGNTVYEQSGATFSWDGKAKDGSEVEEGVYFYKYTVEGLGGEVEGHGFVQIFR